MHCFDGLPVVAFAIAPHAKDLLAPTYSFRLFNNFRPHDNSREDARHSPSPIDLLAGRDAEVFASARFVEALPNTVHVELMASVT